MEYSEFWFFIGALVLTFITGSWVERRHFKSLHKREMETIDLATLTREELPELEHGGEARMIVGSCVIAADFFKRHLASLRFLFGGRVGAYESLLDRARREAILRMKENAIGAKEVICLRIITSNIGPGMVEAVAFGTAIYEGQQQVKNDE